MELSGVDHEVLIPAAVIGLVILAAGLQRITGIGFAMMMAPFLVVMLGPHAGVMLTNLLSFLAPALMVPVVWRDIEWRKLAWIMPAAAVTIPLGAWIAANSPQGPLYIVVSLLVILGLGTSLIVARISREVDGPITRILAGVGAGGGVVLAGVAGPAMAAYSVLSRWEIRKFAATLQPLWVMLALGGFTANLTFSGNQVPNFGWWFWVSALVAILVGMQIGSRLRAKVSEPAVRKLVIWLAFIGAVLSLIMGIRQTFGL